MDTPKEEESSTPVLETTETDGAQSKTEQSAVTEEQWRAIKAITETLLNHRETDGHDPSKIFHKKVNKRFLPGYYDVIKEPIAISTLKANWASREYKSFSEFVRECALIWHNAHTYNRPDAGAYIDATTLKSVMEKEFKKLVDEKIITSDVALWPDLGEIPPVEDLPVEDGDDDDDDDEDDEDDEAEDSDDDEKTKIKRSRPSSAILAKREGGSKDDGQKGGDLGSKKKRGRPPKVDTPMEARIKNVLKSIRKPKNEVGQIMIHHFEKLPDKQTMPEYYAEIKEPIAIELIKRKQKRKKYQSVDHFMRDVDIMFNNAKAYNEDESQIYKDAIYLKEEAHRLADIEKKKPDTDFVMEEGRIPLPNGILHNNELWQVGDWVHIQNANDVTKPIVAQIYRTWQDTEGQKWVNACWYYRPEQTVHQFEKHFFPNEVVKTGQYRDHHIDEIIDRCFVMFFTRYSKGRPRGLAADREVYVCEARYNEEKQKLNKIKTWASCLPDEVREKDYEMDMWETQKKVKKVPSPLLHMLKEDASEGDELPQPRWGAENAPPIVGGIYKGPRDENQSPPPGRTPTPPPPPPPPPQRQASSYDTPSFRRNSEINVAMEEAGRAFGSTQAPTPNAQFQPQSHLPQTPQHQQQTSASAPIQYHQHGSQHSSHTPQPQFSGVSAPPQTAHPDSYGSTPARYTAQQAGSRLGPLPGTTANGQRPVEVYHLSDNANLSIPEDIREQYQRDENGHVLFFTKPPLDVLEPAKRGAAVGHTARYLAAKLRKSGVLKEATVKRELERRAEESQAKKRKQEEDVALAEEIKDLKEQALQALLKQMDEAADATYKNIYGLDRWEEGKAFELARLAARQEEQRGKLMTLAESEAKRAEKRRLHQIQLFEGPPGGVYLDDIDPRY